MTGWSGGVTGVRSCGDPVTAVASAAAMTAPQLWQKRASSSLLRPQVEQVPAMPPPGMVSRIVDRNGIRWKANGTGVSP